MSTLSSYYLATDQFREVQTQTVRLVVGRKGTGKTAMFLQFRDNLRQDRKRVVLDLKPEGHQLKRFKELVLSLLSEAVQEHVASAFWEYVLLLEVCYKLLEKDQQLHLRDHNLFAPYQRLAKLYANDVFDGESDFSGRMLNIVNRVSDHFQDNHELTTGVNISPGAVTQLIHQHDVPQLRNALLDYVSHKNGIFVLLDNIDKGWPTRGLQASDILILRGLLDATRKLEHDFNKRGILFRTTVFLRNDVYELLVAETPDRGKESSVCLDWTDQDLMKEFLRQRLVHNQIPQKSNFQSAWLQIATSHVQGEDSAQFILERSLMRPREFLRLVNHCKASAVNLRHTKILEEDIIKAISTHSSDVARDIGLEIRDVFPTAEDILYCFIGAGQRITLKDVRRLLSYSAVPIKDFRHVIDLLLWFCFFGVYGPGINGSRDTYIYDVFYDIKKLRRLANNLEGDETSLCIHPAFWPFLEVEAL